MNAKAYVKYKLTIHIKSLNEIQRNIRNFRSKSAVEKNTISQTLFYVFIQHCIFVIIFCNNILCRKHTDIFCLVKIQTCRVEIVIKNFNAYRCVTIFLLTCSTYYFLVFLFICLTFSVNIHLRRRVSRSNGSRTMRYPAAHKENVYSLYEDLLLITFLCWPIRLILHLPFRWIYGHYFSPSLTTVAAKMYAGVRTIAIWRENEIYCLESLHAGTFMLL